MFGINGNKASGPDGFTSQFFKDAWDVVGDDVCSAVKSFFAFGKLLRQLNSTSITLIPKQRRCAFCLTPTSSFCFIL